MIRRPRESSRNEPPFPYTPIFRAASGPKSRPARAAVAIVGAVPAGLTAAYLLTQQGYSVTVIEKDPVYVGGISRTVEHEGFRFDIGGHRFFSKSREEIGRAHV